jgi:hypothetical protein
MEFAGGDLVRVIRLPPNAKVIGSGYDGILEGVKGIERHVGPINRILTRDLHTRELLACQL